MAIETTFAHARANLKALLDDVTDDREIVIIHRRGREDVALIAADELRSLLETAHLFRSPKNGERLLRALDRATPSSDVERSDEESQHSEILRRLRGSG